MVIDPAIDTKRLPRHIALIMDGNGRWAQQQGKPRLFGHKAGVDSVRAIVETSREIGIEAITLYAFSTENWNRPEQEVNGLMTILKTYLSAELSRLLKNGIQLRCIGDLDRLPEGAAKALSKVIEATRQNDKLVLNLALSYGGRDELARAARILAERCVKGELEPAAITPELINDNLYTTGLPDPDLMIRTGGEARLSNFLPWQLTYSEIFFTDIMWPDFRREQFLQAISDFQMRERRYGKTSAQVSAE